MDHIFAAHKSKIGYSRLTIYHYLGQGAFSAGQLELPRMVCYKAGKAQNHPDKPIPNYREGHICKDFEQYMETRPEANVVEMDTVEGFKDGPVLLTRLFRRCWFMLIFCWIETHKRMSARFLKQWKQYLKQKECGNSLKWSWQAAARSAKNCFVGAKPFLSVSDAHFLL